MNRFLNIWILLFAGAVGSVQAQTQAPTAEFLCAGYSNWVSTVAFPTSDERVRFVGPLDRSYPSACDARQGSDLVFSIDVTNRTVELNRVVPPGGPAGCPRIYAPVYSLAAEFGPLPSGEWVFSSTSYAFTNTFHVYPGVPAPRLAVESEMGQIRLRWLAVSYLHYEIESSITLTNWQSIEVASTLDGTNRTLFLPAATNHQFFRVKRSPILQTLPFFPTDCGA